MLLWFLVFESSSSSCFETHTRFHNSTMNAIQSHSSTSLKVIELMIELSTLMTLSSSGSSLGNRFFLAFTIK